MSGFETQARILHQSNQIRDQIRSLSEWENDMKKMEAKRIASAKEEEAFDKSYPLRNQMQTSKPTLSSSASSSSSSSSNCQPSTSSAANKLTADMSKRKPSITPPNSNEKADEFKTRGNECVKDGRYEKAIKYYTEAIRLNKSEPVYYTNRALCYLKQSKFTECIDDCTQAIGLDGKAVKAYYRRMQAREQMPDGDLKLALADCKTILQIEPKNVAQQSLGRLQQLVNTAAPTPTAAVAAGITAITATTTTKRVCNTDEAIVPPQALWSQYDGKNGYERIDFITKAPHLRSKEPLKRIAIGNVEQKTTTITVTVDPKQTSESSDKATTTTTPTATLTIAPSTPSTTSHIDQTNAALNPIIHEQKSSVHSIDLMIPKNAAQFYKVWKSLSNDSQKFTVLKGIYDADIGKMLGAQFSVETLREIFIILKSHFIHQNLPVANILSGIVKNAQMPVISVMMNATDRLAFTEMVEYMRVRGEDAKQIDTIQQTFDILISM